MARGKWEQTVRHVTAAARILAPDWPMTVRQVFYCLLRGSQRASRGSARPQGHKGHTAPLSLAYARSALNGELTYLREARVGERNYRLNRAAFRLGQLIATGSLDRSKVETRLTRCALATGLVLAEIEPVIQSALEPTGSGSRGSP